MTGGALQAHLATGTTTICRAWALIRRDGRVLGFTDHDRDLAFEGYIFRADTGLTARALQQTTGLSVDNTEAMGALSDAAITEADIIAGRYDGAEVIAWLVNWADVGERSVQFRGTVGEITRSGGSFTAELRGLAERLNQPQGRVYQRSCSAVLGGAGCGFDLTQPGFATLATPVTVEGQRLFRFPPLPEFAARWFDRGTLIAKSGAAAGLRGIIKSDRLDQDGQCVIELWQDLGAAVTPQDEMQLLAGCDRRAETCREKFNNFLNFRGFPHIPGEDWLTAYPTSATVNDGGSLRR